MLDIGMAAGGENNEDYKFPLRMIRVNLEAALLQIRHMSYVESRQYLSSRKLDAESIINKLQDSYRTLYDNGRWPPAKDSKDSKAMNHSYGRVNLAATNELRNVVNSLVQSQNMEPKSGSSFKPNRFQGKKRRNNNWMNSAPGRGGSKFNLKKGNNTKKANPSLKTPPKKGESVYLPCCIISLTTNRSVQSISSSL